jgi:hypothetical protein
VAPTGDTGMGNESSALHRERSADCFPSNTNLTKCRIASNLPRRSCSLRRHSPMLLAHSVHWLTNGNDRPFLVPCDYIRSFHNYTSLTVSTGVWVLNCLQPRSSK